LFDTCVFRPSLSQGPGRVQPNKDDKADFVNELRETYGVLSPRLELFRRYLDTNDDVQGDSCSKLENDLLFYLEVQKFKVRYFTTENLALLLTLSTTDHGLSFIGFVFLHGRGMQFCCA
jgi:hypothetical protein